MIAKKKKQILVYVYVCGDILHEGHLLQMENGKALGDKLIVGVLTDKAVMEKKEKPVMEFRERLRLVQSLKCVDCVVPQDEYSPLSNLKSMQPDILMESASHIGDFYLEELKREFQGRIIMTPYFPEQSSTAIKNKIKGQKNNEV
ncbi:adenylyltransferase/cytidyltransferase family protein [Candidatus Woesearchaeota archaeon]|nr:adenylyltransferase/cytidyltransferase family protein [archaeon]MBL7055177.1 adenylyltransferase/cytidyltransferase family protein [Candidatus Woesearchaeota archaeon]